MRRAVALIAAVGLALSPLAAAAQSEPPAKFDAAFAPPEPPPSEGFGTAAGEEGWPDERMRTAVPLPRPDLGDEPAPPGSGK